IISRNMKILLETEKDDALFLEALKRVLPQIDGQPVYFLHETMFAGDKEGFECLLNLMGNQIVNDKNANDNNFLHLCSNECLPLALKYTKDIDEKNKFGQTALHTAAKNSNLEKA